MEQACIDFPDQPVNVMMQTHLRKTRIP